MYQNILRSGMALLLVASSAYAQDDLIAKVANNEGEDGFEFEVIIDLEATDVKNQGRSGTCWSYSSNSFLESEMIRLGREPVDISEMQVVRMTYVDKAEKYVRLHGYLNFGQGGALPDVLYTMDKYGLVPQSLYEGLVIGEEVNMHGEMEAVLKGIIDGVKANNNGRISPVWRKTVDATLDAYLGELPASFKWEGKSYTARTFADEVVGLRADDYIQLTSFTHHPMHEKVVIQVPDNWTWWPSYNVTLDEMMSTLDEALENGYTVAWAGDVSEKGFSVKNGVAIVPQTDYQSMTDEQRANMFNGPQGELEIDAALRQKAYDNYETTDDHGMHITGVVKDQEGNKYYITKNSWGTKYGFDGYLYMSEAFVKYKTLSIMIHRDALPKSVAKNLGM
jgi:bleomycin hydrolase